MPSKLTALLLGALVLACDAEAGEADEGTTSAADTTGAAVPRSCVAPEGMGSPATVDETVALINALPKPTTLSCFLESLDRPLAVSATESPRSAQPSTGAENPRLFITRGSLILSVLPEGPGSDRLEFAVDVGDGLSTKGELAFPIEAEIAATEPYAQILRNPGTSCGACHDLEQHWETVDDVPIFASEALQYPAEDHISTGYVSALSSSCDADAFPERCAMLQAVFAHGPVDTQRLPENLKICRLIE